MSALSASLHEIVRDDSSGAPTDATGSVSGTGRADTVEPHRVVLVHCSASSPRQWNPLLVRLEGYRPVTPDLIGHGDRAPWQSARPLALSDEAQIVAEACPDGAPFHLVGHSYGGAVALNYALHHPGRVRSLTLIEPSCFHVLKTAPGNADAQLAEIRAVAATVARRAGDGDRAGAMQGFVDYWSSPGYWSGLPADRRAQLAHLAPTVAAEFRSLIEDETVLATYARVVVPTLILYGTRSPDPSQMVARLLGATMPVARHETIRGVGHMAPISHPDDVNTLILRHLREVDRDLDRP